MTINNLLQHLKFTHDDIMTDISTLRDHHVNREISYSSYIVHLHCIITHYKQFK